MVEWEFDQAEANFCLLVEQACTKGPQMIKRNGQELAVVVSMEYYRAALKASPNVSDAQSEKAK